MPRFKDQAICLRLIDWSETSQIVALLTREHGKVRGLAKGSKRMSPGSVARYSGGIELLTGGEIVGIIRPSSDLATLTEWDLQEPYHHLRTDLQAQRLAYYAADLCNAMLADHDAHVGTFAALSRFLTDIIEPDAHDAALLVFQWRLLEDCGYKPELTADVHSGEPLAEGQSSYSFDATAGGFSAAETQTAGDPRPRNGRNTQETGPWRARRETLELLRAVAANSSVPAGTGAASIQRANRLLCVYARAILDRELPTMAIILFESRLV